MADDASVDVSDSRSGADVVTDGLRRCALAVVALIGVLDYASGPHLSLTLFYLAPIWLVTA